METYVQSALFLYHDQHDYRQGKRQLCKGLRKTKAQLLQACFQIERNKHTTSHATRATHEYASISEPTSSITITEQTRTPPLHMVTSVLNDGDESVLLEESINVEREQNRTITELPSNIEGIKQSSTCNSILDKAEADIFLSEDGSFLFEVSCHVEEADPGGAENSSLTSAHTFPPLTTIPSPACTLQRPRRLVNTNKRVLPQWFYNTSTPLKGTAATSVAKRATTRKNLPRKKISKITRARARQNFLFPGTLSRQ